MSEKLTEQQTMLFHRNFRYMLNKLNISPYQAERCKKDSAAAEAFEIVSADVLPAYSTLIDCQNNYAYVPTFGIVRKVVQFYNRNLTPSVDLLQFLQDDLSQSRDLHVRLSSYKNSVFLGMYFCYYPAASNEEKIHGGILRIYEKGNTYGAALVTGIRTDKALMDPRLTKLFSHVPNSRTFSDYFNTLQPNDQHITYYEGTVEITEDSVLLLMRGASRVNYKTILTLNTRAFQGSKVYDGGMGFRLSTSDGPFDTRFCKIGLIHAKNGCFSLRDPLLQEHLQIELQKNNLAAMTAESNRRWYNLITDAEYAQHLRPLPSYRKEFQK